LKKGTFERSVQKNETEKKYEMIANMRKIYTLKDIPETSSRSGLSTSNIIIPKVDGEKDYQQSRITINLENENIHETEQVADGTLSKARRIRFGSFQRASVDLGLDAITESNDKRSVEFFRNTKLYEVKAQRKSEAKLNIDWANQTSRRASADFSGSRRPSAFAESRWSSSPGWENEIEGLMSWAKGLPSETKQKKQR
jgi:hypothetical protein